MKRFLPTFLFFVLSSDLHAQTAPATAPATQPALSTPLAAATAYTQALVDNDGPALLAAIDLSDETVKIIVTAQANRFTATRHYRDAAQKAFGNVPDNLQPQSFEAQIQKIILTDLPHADIAEHGATATVTPRGMGGMATNPGEPPAPDWGPMFQMTTTLQKDNTWRVRLQDSAQMYKMNLDPSSRIQAEIEAVTNPEIETTAADIAQNKFKTPEEAWQTLRTRMQKVEDAWKQNMMQQRQNPATSPQPR